MKFTAIASSSRGNAYLVESPDLAPLLLEAGIPLKQLREKLSFGVSGLAGVLISHAHMDHAKAVKDLIKMGVDCYMGMGEAKALGVQGHHRIIPVKEHIRTRVGPWVVVPIPLEHDTTEPLGFFISDGNENLLFIPDTEYVKDRFDGVTILAIECNNIEDILSANIIDGHIPTSLGHRIRRTHMSLEQVIAMIKANDLSKCREIHLLHLSDSNSDEAKMIREVQRQTGIPCWAC